MIIGEFVFLDDVADARPTYSAAFYTLVSSSLYYHVNISLFSFYFLLRNRALFYPIPIAKIVYGYTIFIPK